jgi:AraC family transcriptional regulator, regulatory protein of adaptative response / DNA-3-methyladenine glycosylase II
MAVPTAAPTPIDWAAALAYLAARATAGVESVTQDHRYARTARMLGHTGYVVVAARRDGRDVVIGVSGGLQPVLEQVAARIRKVFDLDTDPRPIAAHFARDPLLAPLVDRRPNLRLIGAMDGFELAVRAVLGQAVTVRAASLMAARLTDLAAEPLPDAPFGLTHLPITPGRLAQVSPQRIRSIGITRSRAECLLELARATADGALPELVTGEPVHSPAAFIQRFTALPGIGPWTAHYVAMRTLGWADAFPEDDLGLRKAAGGLTPCELRDAAERWRPWRAYAACHLWGAITSRARLSRAADC